MLKKFQKYLKCPALGPPLKTDPPRRSAKDCCQPEDHPAHRDDILFPVELGGAVQRDRLGRGLLRAHARGNRPVAGAR